MNHNLLSIIKKKHISLNEKKIVSSGKKIIYLTPETYIFFRKNTKQIEHIDHIVFDGFFIVFLLRFFGIKVKTGQSFDFSSLATPIFTAIVENNLKLYIIGAKDEELMFFKKIVQSKFPRINIVGTNNGYFDVNDDEALNIIKEKIIKSEADFLLVGLGSIKQEIFTNKMADFPNITIFTCGAFISQTKISINYFPKILKTLHLRWLVRFIKEPRIIKRVIKFYPALIFSVFYDWLKYKKEKLFTKTPH